MNHWPGLRPLVLGVLMLAGAVGVAALLGAPRPSVVHVGLSAGLLLVFFIADTNSLDVRIGRETYSITIAEAPLTAGLLLISPVALVLVRACATLAGGIYKRGWVRVEKLAVNVVVATLETIAAAVTYGALVSIAPNDGRAYVWIALVGGALAAAIAGFIVVTIAIRLTSKEPVQLLLTPLLVLAVAAASGAALVIVGDALIRANPSALIALAALMLVLLLAYRAYRSALRREASLALVHRFGQEVAGISRLDQVAATIVQEVRRLLRADGAELWIERDGDWLVARGISDAAPAVEEVSGAPAPLVDLTLQAEADHLLCGPGTKDVFAQAALRAMCRDDVLAVTVNVEPPRRAVLLVADRIGDVDTFSAEDATFLQTLAQVAGSAIRNATLACRLRQEAEERERRASTDSLTGLANRSGFHAAVGKRLMEESESAVLLLDLDQFKEVNDALGHSTGDLLLREVGKRLPDALQRDAIVARLGGDEFVVHVPDVDVTGATEAARRIRDALRPAFEIDEMMLQIDASIGVALAPHHGDDPHTLLQRADVAMYAAKAARSGVEVYAFDQDRHSHRRVMLVGELRRAIEQDELVLHYQPKVRLSDGAVIGVEALVRWAHAGLGIVGPDEFIPIAEQSGLIHPLTRWVLQTATNDCARWRADGHELSVAVNLSPRSLLDRDLLENLHAVLAARELPASALTLEITESTLVTDPTRSITTMKALADLGVQLSVDDFGTGYSSLQYLKRLPVDEVKIDRTFVRSITVDARDEAIVRAVTDLSHRLGKQVVAEGVEDRQSYELLTRIGVDAAQGYWLTRPLPENGLRAWMREHELAMHSLTPLVRDHSSGPRHAETAATLD